MKAPNVTTALKVLTPTAQFGVVNEQYSGIQWFSPDIPQPTEDEVNAEIAKQIADQPLEACKQKAQALLDASDWATKSDVTDITLHPHLINVSDFVAYRLALRTLRINPVAEPIWPAYPQEIWSD